jgi:hypothetical protein
MKQLFSFPIHLSETNLVYDILSSACDIEQANYVQNMFILDGIETVIIYTAGCNTWKNADLIYPCSPITLKPAYWEFMGQSQMTEFPIPPP